MECKYKIYKEIDSMQKRTYTTIIKKNNKTALNDRQKIKNLKLYIEAYICIVLLPT